MIGYRVLSFAACLLLVTCGGNGGNGGNGEVDVLHETCGPDVCPSPPECGSGEVRTCCTCIRVPSMDAMRTTCDLLGEYCAPSSGSPDISCYMPDGYPVQDEPGSAILHGPIDVYATGLDSYPEVLVEVYEADADGNLGTLVGEYISDDTCQNNDDLGEFPAQHETEDEARDCPGPCQEKLSADSTDCRNLGYYVIEDVPTNVPLIVKTSQVGGGALWKDMLSFNIWFFDDEIGADGGLAGHIFYKARVVSLDDWRNIPVAAGDTSGIASGYAAVAGEIHDCGDVRISFAMASTHPEANTLTYFNGVEEHLYPDLGRGPYGTNIDGLYAALEVGADSIGMPVWVSAIAQVAGVGVVSLGWQKAYAYPDTLTSVTLRGTRPDQVD